ncbi:hypothetical protein M569_12441 [Genlisea aurea]|uniref:Uncharacterized protein n=1 Tax=Genlisea aurea TaxID=192259 RepID=S8C6F2_9LAMI|nr:hypothetical protein M569_12441 [Genlisea aurea]
MVMVPDTRNMKPQFPSIHGPDELKGGLPKTLRNFAALKNFKASDQNSRVFLPNDSHLSVSGKGHFELTPNIELSDVLKVSGFRFNLASVYWLC